MGARIGHISEQNVALITFVGAVTFVVSTYMIMNGNKLYKIFSPYIDIFERDGAKEKNVKSKNFKDHVILIGARKMGGGILETLIRNEEDLVVVDFDPDVIDKLKTDGIESYFGDITDLEIQELAALEHARIVISTISDLEDNLHLLTVLSSLKKRPKIVMLAIEKQDAKKLYDEGADYVIIPHIAGGNHLAKILGDKDHLRLIEEYASKEKDYIS